MTPLSWILDGLGHRTAPAIVPGFICVFRLYLRIPRWLAQDRLQLVTLPVLPRIQGLCGLGATLFHLATSLYEEAEALSVEEGVAAIEAYLDILHGCVGGRAPTSRLSHHPDLYSSIESFIQIQLPEPSLNPTKIAAGAGISVRHLHRLFSSRGCSVTDWIRGRRLERCRTDLADPRLRERSITEIAFLWGFSDSAHFSRSFKKQFGVSPRAFRSQPRAASAADEQTERIETLLSTSSRGTLTRIR